MKTLEEKVEYADIIKKYTLRAAGGKIYAGITPPPDVIELIKVNRLSVIAEIDSIAAARQAKIEAAQAEYKAAQDAIDAPCLAAMEARVEELRMQIPSGMIGGEAREAENANGNPIMEYFADGIKLPFDAITIVGWASAIRPGAMGSFKQKCICYTSRERIEAERARIADRQAKSEATKQEADKKLADALATAKATGERQVIRRWVTQDCMRGGRDCSFDSACEFVLPDGSRRTEYTCCY